MSYLSRFNIRVTGEAHLPKVVFLHGLMGFLNNWGSVTRRLSSKYQCLVYDQRGHGKSMKPDSGYHPKDFADDLHKILHELQWNSVNLVGHSMGGRNALYFSYLYPGSLKSLVIEDIGPDGNPDNYVYYQNMLDAIPTPFRDKAAIQNFFEHTFASVFTTKEHPKTIIPFLMANLEEKEGGLYDWKFSKQAIIDSVKLGRSENVWPLIEQISVPTLYMRGERSKDLEKSVYEHVLTKNSLITGVEISDAGHWIHSDQPEVFTETLEGFLDRINY
ncbi:MAG: alpha/beta hydrolase [Bdellovibrionaceae bacterium]|nr:alpha/beta hydrolase [Pseudobdellovibrionaceae bacterium]